MASACLFLQVTSPIAILQDDNNYRRALKI